jgi:hypothetical protein
MNFSISSIFAGLIFGVIGFWLLREGRKKGNMHIALIGVGLMGYSYFTNNPWADWGIGLGLCYLARHFWNHS